MEGGTTKKNQRFAYLNPEKTHYITPNKEIKPVQIANTEDVHHILCLTSSIPILGHPIWDMVKPSTVGLAAFAHQTLHQLVRADAGQHAALTQRLLGLGDPGELYQVP